MAQSADILTRPDQKVILPDLAAGCSMADMARLRQVEEAWAALESTGVAGDVVPVTHMNSSADIKAFCGRHGGAVCTSSNARTALEWAFAQRPDGGGMVLFLPDQHLGRNTAVLQLGLGLGDCVVWDPHLPVAAAPPGSVWAIGTELNLVKRLAAAHPEQRIVFLEKTVCYCSTMNRIEVDPETERWARVALERMLALPGRTERD